jgi:hypothetical protein
MRKVFAAAVCAGLVAIATLIARGTMSHPRQVDGRNNVELESLQAEVSRLQTRVGAAETVSVAALAQARKAGAPTTPPSTNENREPTTSGEDHNSRPDPLPMTEKQQADSFRMYFEQIDLLRGSSSDVSLEKKVRDALSVPEWKQGMRAKGPAEVSVDCGNGYCRVSLSFTDRGDAEVARSTLPIAAMTFASGMTVFLDPETLRVEGYFATAGHPLPSFPAQI